MKVNLIGGLILVGVGAAAVFLVRYAPALRAAAAKINPASRENLAYQATGEWGTYVPDLFGGLFKSDAEKKVDEMLRAPAPTKKTVITPASSGYEHSPASFGTSARAVGELEGPSWEGFYGN